MAVSILNCDQQRNLMEEPAGVSFNWSHVKLLWLFIGSCAQSLSFGPTMCYLFGAEVSVERSQWLRNKQQASWTPTSTCLLSLHKRAAHDPANRNVRFLLHLFWLSPSSCVDVFTSLWNEANDNSVFLYLNGMAKLLWYSLQRRNNVWAGLGKTFLPFLPSHPPQAICSLFLLNIMPVQMVCFASWAQGSFFNNKGQVGNLLVTPKMVGHGFYPVLRSEIPLEMWCKPWSLTEMYHPTLEFSLLTLCCHF